MRADAPAPSQSQSLSRPFAPLRRNAAIGGVGLVVALLAGLGFFAALVGAAAAKVAPETPPAPQAAPDRPAPPAEPGFAYGVFGSVAFKTAGHRFGADWRDVRRRIREESGLYETCDAGGSDCPPGVRRWRRLIAELGDLPRREQVARLNRSINRLVRYADDGEAFGEEDHWATPAEALRESGDCEDYAILKFRSLLELGFDDERLRFAIVRDRRRGAMHAVVTVRLGEETLVLDNRFDHPVGHQHILKYEPLYSANLEAQWAHVVTPKIRARFVTRIMERARAGADGGDSA